MKAFHSGREAKEFLISKVVEEAQLDGVPLCEIERKMLYFTESGWTLPDIMQVSQEFDREYDQDEYEKRIAQLVTKADRRIRKESRDEYDKWWAAIRFLQREDHYISVMIGMAGLKPRGDQLRLFAVGLGIVTCLLIWEFLGVPMPSSGSLEIFVCLVLASLFAAYILLRLIVGKKRADDLVDKVFDQFVRIYQRVSGSA